MWRDGEGKGVRGFQTRRFGARRDPSVTAKAQPLSCPGLEAGSMVAPDSLPSIPWVPGLQRIIPLTLHAAQRTGHDISCLRVLAARFRPSFYKFVCPLLTRGRRGMPG